MHDFDRHTAVRRVASGCYAAEFDPTCVVGGAVNGGYLLATVGRAAADALSETGWMPPAPISVSAHFMSVTTPGPATIHTTPVVGATAGPTTVYARLCQGDRTRLMALATYGELSKDDGPTLLAASPPELPDRADCINASWAPPEVRDLAPMIDHFELLFDPECVTWIAGRPSGRGQIQGWFRWADGHEPDPIALLMVVDALPPVTYDLGLEGWAPTTQLTVHVRALPAAGWLRVSHHTRHVAAGRFEEDCEVWDSAGRMVAQSRQLASLPRERR